MSPTCPLCSARHARLLARVGDVEYATPGGPWSYWQCRDCRAIFLEDPPRDRLRDIYPPSYYAAHPDDTLGWLQRVKERLEAGFFRRVLSLVPGDDLSVMDVGGGTGWMASQVRRADPRVVRTAVVDLDENMRAAAEKGGHTFYCASVEDFRCDQQFSVMLLLNLIEHVADPAAVLKNLTTRLEPRGRMLIKTPNTDAWDRRLYESTYWGGYHAPRHWVLFDQANFRDLANRCGLEVESLRLTQGAPFWATSWMAALAQRNLVRSDAQRPMLYHPLMQVFLAAGAALDMIRSPFAPTSQMFIVLKHSAA